MLLDVFPYLSKSLLFVRSPPALTLNNFDKLSYGVPNVSVRHGGSGVRRHTFGKIMGTPSGRGRGVRSTLLQVLEGMLCVEHDNET